MDMLCPTCRGPLTRDGEIARCPSHAGTFQILYLRPPQTAPAAPVASVAPGPEVATEASPFSDTSPTSSPAESANLASALTLSVSPPPPPPPPLPSRFAAMRCVQHPSVPASAQCCSCGAYACATCDFPLPNDQHVCPACAIASQTGLSPKRKRGLRWSLGLAIWASLGMAGLFVGAAAGAAKTQVAQNILGLLFTVLVLLPSIIGFGIGLSTVDRRLVNPPLLWVATIWNALIAAGFFLLAVIGST